MAAVTHFSTDEGAKAACGARLVLCEDYTDDRRYVDCGRCKRTKQFTEYDPQRFDVDVWNHEGDVIRWFRRVNADEVDDIRREYGDNSGTSIVVTEAAAAGA